MTAALAELHDLITDLDGEAHPLAGRFRDVAERLRVDLEEARAEGQFRRDSFADAVADRIRSDLQEIRAQIVTDLPKFLISALRRARRTDHRRP